MQGHNPVHGRIQRGHARPVLAVCNRNTYKPHAVLGSLSQLLPATTSSNFVCVFHIVPDTRVTLTSIREISYSGNAFYLYMDLVDHAGVPIGYFAAWSSWEIRLQMVYKAWSSWPIEVGMKDRIGCSSLGGGGGEICNLKP